MEHTLGAHSDDISDSRPCNCEERVSKEKEPDYIDGVIEEWHERGLSNFNSCGNNNELGPKDAEKFLREKLEQSSTQRTQEVIDIINNFDMKVGGDARYNQGYNQALSDLLSKLRETL